MKFCAEGEKILTFFLCYREKLFVKNCLVSQKVSSFIICQPSINFSLHSHTFSFYFPTFLFHSLSNFSHFLAFFSLPYLPFPFPTFLFPFLPSFSLPYLPCHLCSSLIPIFVFLSHPSSFTLNLPVSLALFPFPYRTSFSQPFRSLLFPFPTFPDPYLSPSLPVHFPPYLSTSLPTFPPSPSILPHPSLSSIVTVPLSLSFFSLLLPILLPLFLTFLLPFSFPFSVPVSFPFSFPFSFPSPSLGSLISFLPRGQGGTILYSPGFIYLVEQFLQTSYIYPSRFSCL